MKPPFLNNIKFYLFGKKIITENGDEFIPTRQGLVGGLGSFAGTIIYLCCVKGGGWIEFILGIIVWQVLLMLISFLIIKPEKIN